MNAEKKNEIKQNIETLIADWSILKDIDIGYRLNSIRSKWFRANIEESKLKKLMSDMGKKGGRGKWKKTVLKNISYNVIKN